MSFILTFRVSRIRRRLAPWVMGIPSGMFVALILLLFLSIPAGALSKKQLMIKWWDQLGYSFELLDKEVGFSPLECLETQAAKSHCLMAFEELAFLLPEPQSIRLDVSPNGGNVTFRLVPSESLAKSWDKPSKIKRRSKARLHFKEKLQEALRAQVMAGRSGDSGEWLGQLRHQLFFLAKGIEEPRRAYIAASTYRAYLRERYDPHTRLVPGQIFADDPVDYVGLGLDISMLPDVDAIPLALRGGFVVERLEKHGTAKAVGIRKGDVILAVNGEDIRGWEADKVDQEIEGRPGANVRLRYHSFCKNQIVEVELRQRRLVVRPKMDRDSYFVPLIGQDPMASLCPSKGAEPSLEGRAQALYVPIPSFLGPRICENFKAVLEKDLSNPLSKGLIIDLRNNGGGSLQDTGCMLDALISGDGPIFRVLGAQDQWSEGVFIQDEYLYRPRMSFTKRGTISPTSSEETVGTGSADGMSRSRSLSTYNRNVVVLVNALSASASEIFAGVIQDMNRGWVVGSRTYGKASIQDIYYHLSQPELISKQLSTSVLWAKTIGIYTLPSGWSPQGVGVLPDFQFFADGEATPSEEFEKGIVREEDSHNAVVFRGGERVVERGPEITGVNNCISRLPKKGEGQLYREKMVNHPAAPYRFPKNNYVDWVAKDILNCSAPVPDTIR